MLRLDDLEDVKDFPELSLHDGKLHIHKRPVDGCHTASCFGPGFQGDLVAVALDPLPYGELPCLSLRDAQESAEYLEILRRRFRRAPHFSVVAYRFQSRTLDPLILQRGWLGDKSRFEPTKSMWTRCTRKLRKTSAGDQNMMTGLAGRELT